MKNTLLMVCCCLTLISPAVAATGGQVKVSVMKPKSVSKSKTLMLAGTVESVKNSKLAVLESGVVAELFVDVGDKVDKGQKLLQLDDKLARLKLEELIAFKKAKQTELAEAKRLHEEVLALSTKQFVAKTLIEQRRVAIDLASAALKQAQSQFRHQQELVARFQLKAPFSGIIAKRTIDIGEWATPQAAVLNLVSQDQLRVKFEVPQDYLALLANNKTSVTVLPNTKGLPTIEASIDRIVKVTSEQSRTFPAYVNIEASSQLVAGMSVNANIALPHTEQSVVWLPKSAIKQHPDGGQSVFAVQDNKAKRFLVNVIDQALEQVAVTGVPKQLPIITKGIALLRDGETVTTTAHVDNAL